MPILCPVCRKAGFETIPLEPDLSAERCTTCHGVWLTSVRYFGFLASGSHDHAASDGTDVGPDSSALKLCPSCQRFMRWYEIGHGLAFGVDRCGACGGMWLNAGEWEALKARGLHVKLHFVASAAWQADLARTRRQHHEAEDLARRLGEADFHELQRLTQWLKNHPHRNEMAAYLREHLRSE